MKKFLTVLLALSVVFTYSFSAVGSAFAATATTSEYEQKLAQAESGALTDYAKVYDAVKADINLYTEQEAVVGGYPVSVAELLKQLDLLYKAEQEILKAYTKTMLTEDNYNANSDKTVDELKAMYLEEVKDRDELADEVKNETTYGLAAAKAQFAVDKAKAIADAAAVKTSDYSSRKQADSYPEVEIGAGKKVTTDIPKEYADALVANTVYELGKVVLAENADIAAIKIAAKSLKTKLEAHLEVKDGVYVIKASYDLPTVNDDKVDDMQSAATKAEALAIVASNIAQHLEVKDGVYVIKASYDLPTVNDDKVDDMQSAATKAEALAIVASNIAQAAAKEEVVLGSAAEIAAFEKLSNAYSKVWDYLINNDLAAKEGNKITVAAFPNYTFKTTNNVVVAKETATSYQAVVTDMDEVAGLAITLKALKDADGNLAYDAAEIEKKVDETYKTQYPKYKDAAYTAVANISLFEDAKQSYSDAFAKEHAKAIVAKLMNAEEMKYNSKAYYAREWAEVIAAVNTYNSAVDASATQKQIREAKDVLDAAIAKVKDIEAITGVAGLYTTDTELAAAVVTAWNVVETHLNSVNADKTGDAQKDNPFTQDTLKVWLAEQGARTAAEVKALHNAAKVEIDKAPTKSEAAAASAAAVKKVKDMIAALPAELKVEMTDADAVIAALEAYEALTDVEKAAASAAAVKKVKDMIAALPAELKVEMTDADAVIAALEAYEALTDVEKVALTADKAVLDKIAAAVAKKYAAEIDTKIADMAKTGATSAAIDAVKPLIETYKKLNGTTSYDLTVQETAAKAADKNAVIAAINALPTKITLDHKESVEAARALYDAYVARYTDYTKENGNAAKDITNISTLLMAEATIDTLKVASVESLKLSVSTKLYTGSNKIRVNWKVKGGDASYIDGYQVYKSTKANSGYKFMGKTKKNYMDNKKNLKKGTRYFYKVRAYVEIDGQKYYSDWSNKGNRIYK